MATSQLKEPLMVPFSSSDPASSGARTPPSAPFTGAHPSLGQNPCTLPHHFRDSSHLRCQQNRRDQGDHVVFHFVYPQVPRRVHKSILWLLPSISGVSFHFVYTMTTTPSDGARRVHPRQVHDSLAPAGPNFSL